MSKVIYFLLFFALTIPLSAQSKSKDVLIFEINRGERTGSRFSSDTYYFYQSGRVSCKSENNTNPDRKLRKAEKSKCHQISLTTINELTELAKQTDFQTTSYQYFGGGVDWGTSLSITYFDKAGNKEIILTNPRQAKPGKIPPSLAEFLDRIGYIDKRLKVSYGLPNKITMDQ